jgi:putative FmdB family regulatory protein
MPTYEFRCPEGHEFEKFYRKISDAVELPCPVCGKMATRLVSGGAGFLFKGSGFYLTDYGKNAHRKAAPGSGGDSGKSGGDSKSGDGTSAGATESKPAETKASESKPSETKSASESTTAKKPSPSTPKSDS